MTPKNFRAVCRAFLLLSGLVTLAGLIWLVRTAAFVAGATRASGAIIALKEEPAVDRSSTNYFPLFVFSDSSGTIHTQRSYPNVTVAAFEPGQKIVVLYSPNSPEHSKIDSAKTLWFGPLLCTGGGLLQTAMLWFVSNRLGRRGQAKMEA